MTIRLVVVVDVWLTRDAEGNLWSTHPTLSMTTLERYFMTGRDVTLVARFDAERGTRVHRLDESRLRFVLIEHDNKGLPIHRRVLVLLRGLLKVRFRSDDLVVLRLPELVSSLAWFVATVARSNRVANVVADAGSVDSRFGLGVGLRLRAVEALIRWMTRRSRAVVYVSESSRSRYPANHSAPTLVASNVSIDGMALASRARHYGSGPAEWTICSIGSHDSMVKGHDLLLRAVAELLDGGLSVRLSLVGDGTLNASLRQLAVDLGIAGFVDFHGFVQDRATVQGLLAAADLYVQPSRSEGLPRALLEAMALGICSLGSDVGGIPDLLAPELVFKTEDVHSQAEALRRIMVAPELATEAAEACLDQARLVLEGAAPARVSEFLVAVSGGRSHSPTRGTDHDD